MLKELRADMVYIVCRYMDIWRSIDGLVVIVQQNFKLDVFSGSLFLFYGRKRERLKQCCGRVTDFCFCTNAWTTERSNGHVMERRQES